MMYPGTNISHIWDILVCQKGYGYTKSGKGVDLMCFFFKLPCGEFSLKKQSWCFFSPLSGEKKVKRYKTGFCNAGVAYCLNLHCLAYGSTEVCGTVVTQCA